MNLKDYNFSNPPNIYLSMTKDGYFALQKLLQAEKNIDLIISRPQEKSANISDYIDFSPIAESNDIPLLTTTKINTLGKRIDNLQPNLIIVNGWSELLSQKIIDLPRYGCVGTHPALLPKNRGRAPIAWHFLNREKYGGVSLFYLDAGCDSGPIIDQVKFKIKPKDNASTYYQKITKLGSEILLKHFDQLDQGSAKSTPQDHTKATYLLKRRPQDSFLCFQKSAQQVHNQIRAVSDVYPQGFFFYKKNKYLVLNSSLATKIPPYSGVPGQIARITNKNLLVLCKKKLISLDSIVDKNKVSVNISQTFKVGDVLNE